MSKDDIKIVPISNQDLIDAIRNNANYGETSFQKAKLLSILENAPEGVFSWSTTGLVENVDTSTTKVLLLNNKPVQIQVNKTGAPSAFTSPRSIEDFIDNINNSTSTSNIKLGGHTLDDIWHIDNENNNLSNEVVDTDRTDGRTRPVNLEESLDRTISNKYFSVPVSEVYIPDMDEKVFNNAIAGKDSTGKAMDIYVSQSHIKNIIKGNEQSFLSQFSASKKVIKTADGIIIPKQYVIDFLNLPSDNSEKSVKTRRAFGLKINSLFDDNKFKTDRERSAIDRFTTAIEGHAGEFDVVKQLNALPASERNNYTFDFGSTERNARGLMLSYNPRFTTDIIVKDINGNIVDDIVIDVKTVKKYRTSNTWTQQTANQKQIFNAFGMNESEFETFRDEVQALPENKRLQHIESRVGKKDFLGILVETTPDGKGYTVGIQSFKHKLVKGDISTMTYANGTINVCGVGNIERGNVSTIGTYLGAK